MILPLEQRVYITFRMYLTGVEVRLIGGLMHITVAVAGVVIATWHCCSVERKVTEVQKVLLLSVLRRSRMSSVHLVQRDNGAVL
jgi:hypothetical protein